MLKDTQLILLVMLLLLIDVIIVTSWGKFYLTTDWHIYNPYVIYIYIELIAMN